MQDVGNPLPPPAAPKKRATKVRLFLLLGLGVVLVLGAALYLRLGFYPTVGAGPAGPDVGSSAFEKPWTTRPVLLVGLGDSITAGFGARRGYSYFDRLIKNPLDEFPGMGGICLSRVFPNLRATNLAVSGSISSGLLDGQLPLLPVADPQTLGWVVITTGGNDLIHDYGKSPPREQAMYGATWQQAQPWIRHYEDRLEKIYDQISGRFPGGCQIFMANIYDPPDASGHLERAGLPAWPDGLRIHAAFNDVILRFSERHTNVHRVNIHQTFLGHGLNCRQFWSRHYDRRDPHYWYFSNLEDPNERGYDVLRRLFLLEMSRASGSLRDL
jgi:lysophospholipase L1-like esterase